jgi:hypothetical protein
MEKLKVKDYKKFKKFDYHNEPNPDVELGDVIYKEYEKFYNAEPEIGIVIQTHEPSFGFRTDMFGNESFDHYGKYGTIVTFATMEQVQKYRPDILNELK